MGKIKTYNNQSICDIAVQHDGNVSAVFDIALLNDRGITDDVPSGIELEVPDAVDALIVNYYNARGIAPANEVVTSIKPTNGLFENGLFENGLFE